MTALREKSEKLTAYLEMQIREKLSSALQIITPAEAPRRGCQLSLRVIGGRERGRDLFDTLARRGIIGDWREPDVIRISPTPLYNRYQDVFGFVQAVEQWRDNQP